MKIVKFLFLIFILFQTPIKVNSNENLKTSLEHGKKLIFIRHAYAPGSGDPSNFNIKKRSKNGIHLFDSRFIEKKF